MCVCKHRHSIYSTELKCYLFNFSLISSLQNKAVFLRGVDLPPHKFIKSNPRKLMITFKNSTLLLKSCVELLPFICIISDSRSHAVKNPFNLEDRMALKFFSSQDFFISKETKATIILKLAELFQKSKAEKYTNLFNHVSNCELSFVIFLTVF